MRAGVDITLDPCIRLIVELESFEESMARLKASLSEKSDEEFIALNRNET